MTNPKTASKNTLFIEEFQDRPDESPDSGSEAKAPTEDFSKLLDESLRKPNKKLSVGDQVQAKILVIGAQDVFVTTGTRLDGVVPKSEFVDAAGLIPFKVGDVVELYVTLVRGDEVRLSRQKSAKHLAEDLEDAYDLMLAIPGRIVEVCKGGVRVNLKGKLAFCPISQIDTKRVENAEEYVGKSFEFRITQFSEGGRNIVVSRKILLQEEGELNSGSFLEENKDGDIVTGKVVRLEKFGAFVELAPGVDGLVHISEIAGYRIGDPSDVLQSGQEVKVKLLKRETVNGKVKISLSIKQANPVSADGTGAGAQGGATPGLPGSSGTAAPAKPKYSVGQVFTGKVSRKEPYGLFVQIEPGVTGLLHQSRLNDHPEIHFAKVRVGDSISVQIAEIKSDDQKISLQIPRDPDEDDWKNVKQASTSFGSLGDQLKASLLKKK